MKKTLGIIGGMGPLATADLFHKIVLLTNAKSDREHIHILVDSNTKIPDRTEAILHGGEDPLPEIIGSARRLEQAGAQILMMACNTAHFYYQEIVNSVDIPILNMLEETAVAVKKQGISQVGLLATDATLQMQLYHKPLIRQKIDVITPSSEGQKCVMDLIYKGVKAGNFSLDIQPFLHMLQQMCQKGAEAFILGCTELPIAFERFSVPFPAIDPTDVLAKAAIVAAGYEVQNA
jgi:aspartate racemase